MEGMDSDWRNEPISEQTKFWGRIIFGLVLMSMVTYLGSKLFLDDISYHVNLFTTFIGFGITIFVLDTRNEARAKRQLREQLLRQLRSGDQGVVWQALEEIRANGWFVDGTLKRTNLRRANLKDAELVKMERTLTSSEILAYSELTNDMERFPLASTIHYVQAFPIRNFPFRDLERFVTGCLLTGIILQEANLSGAILAISNLKYANLLSANLQNAYLVKSNFEGALLSGSNLGGADISGVDFTNAILTYANLEKATAGNVILRGANLIGANLKNLDWDYIDRRSKKVSPTHPLPRIRVICDANTILPDGSTYTNEEDLLRFIDPKQENFWTSQEFHSPAYRETSN